MREKGVDQDREGEGEFILTVIISYGELSDCSFKLNNTLIHGTINCHISKKFLRMFVDFIVNNRYLNVHLTNDAPIETR